MLRKLLHLTMVLFTFLASLIGWVPVVSAQSQPEDLRADRALCLPGLDESWNTDCLEAGPAARLNELGLVGITFPEAPIFAATPPVELAQIPFTYAVVSNEEVPLYATLEDAAAKMPTNKLIASRIKYVSLVNKAATDNGTFYQIATTEWISSEHVSKVGVQNFQGFEFNENPAVVFGWILSETTTRSAPSYAAPEDGRKLWRYNVVHIYASEVINNIEWVMVGPDEWIEHRFVGRVIPNYTRPEGVPVDRWIEINLYEQVMTVYENGNLLFATLISSGVHPFYTQPGVFQVYKKLESDPMSGSFEADKSDYYYLEEVPFILYYDKLRALHGAYWNTLFGYQRSHGCVNLSVADAHWIFNWADLEDYVYVWDPSGKTPTDPDFYGEGGV